MRYERERRSGGPLPASDMRARICCRGTGPPNTACTPGRERGLTGGRGAANSPPPPPLPISLTPSTLQHHPQPSLPPLPCQRHSWQAALSQVFTSRCFFYVFGSSVVRYFPRNLAVIVLGANEESASECTAQFGGWGGLHSLTHLWDSALCERSLVGACVASYYSASSHTCQVCVCVCVPFWFSLCMVSPIVVQLLHSAHRHS